MQKKFLFKFSLFLLFSFFFFIFLSRGVLAETRAKTQKEIGEGFGTCKNLIPCTKCQLSDIPKLVGNILNCLLWTLSPIAIIFLLLYTGIEFYFSLGNKEAIERVKSLWKSAAIGWLIIFFSWSIVNLIVKFFE